MEMILAFILAWICTLSGVALGGFLVFRTKREGYDSLFKVKPPEGQAFNLDDDYSFDQTPTKTEIPKPVDEANSKFMEQFAESLAEKAGGK
jgi:hypothetical protein